MVLRLIRVLPGVPGFLATVACRSSSANLIPASGDQDHTISPSASAALVFRRLCVHRIPPPTFVTIGRSAPCVQQGCGEINTFFGKTEAIFFGKGLDRPIRLKRLAKSAFRHRRFWVWRRRRLVSTTGCIGALTCATSAPIKCTVTVIHCHRNSGAPNLAGDARRTQNPLPRESLRHRPRQPCGPQD